MGKDVTINRNTKVFYRIYPMEKMKWEHVKILEDKKTIFCQCLQDFLPGKEGEPPTFWKFETDGIFYNDSQKNIYKEVLDGVLESVIKGNNAIIFAYGQTGTGKTLTISGLQNLFEDRGLAPRVISDLFKVKSLMKDNMHMSVLMSFVETSKIYITDLLGDSNKLLDSTSIKFITVKKIKDEYDALKTLYLAEGRRDYAKNSPHNSHTSNGVLTFHIIRKKTDLANPIKIVSKLHLVDLAGADTFGNESCFYKNPLDVGIGNIAKTLLEQFVLVLGENIPEQTWVKQRLNVLILYLSDSLNNHSLLRFVGHIRIRRCDLMITISMLRFGEIVKGIKSFKQNKQHICENEEVKIKILEKQLLEYKKERDLTAMVLNENLSNNVNQERVKQMENVAKEYLQNKTDELVLLTVSDINTVIKVFKNLYNELESDKEECIRKTYEKAYADALASIETTSSTEDAHLSIKGSKTSRGSRKLSIKAREGYKKKTDRSGSQILKRDKSSTSMKSDKQGKLFGKRHSTGRRPSQSRRKSSIGTVSKGDKKPASIPEEPLLEGNLLPENIPTYEEAWNAFTENPDYNYKDLLQATESYDEETKTANKNYLIEVKNLQEFIELVETRKSELLQAEMQRQHLQKEELDEDGNVILSENEKYCLENLEKAQQELVKQQENVLKQQAELKIALSVAQATKKLIDDQFKQFCIDCYQTIVTAPEVKELPEEKPTKTEEEDIVDSVPIKLSVSEQYNSLMKFDGLKELMKKQMAKKIFEAEKTKKWVQPYKIFKL